MARITTETGRNPPPSTFPETETGLRVFTDFDDEPTTDTCCSAMEAAAGRLDAFLADIADDLSPRSLRFPPEIERTDSLFAAARQIGDPLHAMEDDLPLPDELMPEAEALCRELRAARPGDGIYTARIPADHDHGYVVPGRSIARAFEAIPQLAPQKKTAAASRRDPSLEKARVLSHELDTWRQRRIVRLLDRYDLQNKLPPSYQQLKDDSLIFLPKLRGYRLQASVNVQRVGGLCYSLGLPRRGLSGLLLAPVADIPPARGSLRMEILLPTGEVAARATFPAAELERDLPVRLEFAPLEACDRPCRLAVFADDVDVPLYVLEWRKFRWWGLGHTQSQPFCGLLFAEEP